MTTPAGGKCESCSRTRGAIKERLERLEREAVECEKSAVDAQNDGDASAARKYRRQATRLRTRLENARLVASFLESRQQPKRSPPVTAAVCGLEKFSKVPQRRSGLLARIWRAWRRGPG